MDRNKFVESLAAMVFNGREYGVSDETVHYWANQAFDSLQQGGAIAEGTQDEVQQERELNRTVGSQSEAFVRRRQGKHGEKCEHRMIKKTWRCQDCGHTFVDRIT